MVVGERGIQTIEVVLVVLLLLLLLSNVSVPTSANPLLFLDKWFVQIYSNVNFHSFESYSFKPWQGSRVFHFIVHPIIMSSSSSSSSLQSFLDK